jgi:hypothetical protein
MGTKKLNPTFEDLGKAETLINHVNQLKNNNTHHEFRSKYLIDVNETISEPPIAWVLKNKNNNTEAVLGTLGDFGVIIGKAKSKKSFFISIAVSAALSNGFVLDRFKSYLPNNQNEVAYFDTEQSKHYVQKAVKRICKQLESRSIDRLHTFNLRSLSPSERLLFIENEIYSNPKIGFVVIDGIKDLVTSINSEEEATMIASKLLKWSEERNLFILNVLHQNKSDNNARGHIGTELINKAHTVLSVTKSDTDNNISIVEPQQCRDKEPEIFAFEINDQGIPIEAENFELRTETKKNRFDITNLDDYKKFQLLNEVFSHDDNFGYSALLRQLKLAYKKEFNVSIGDNRLKDLITNCKNKGYIIQIKPKAPYKLGSFDNTNGLKK